MTNDDQNIDNLLNIAALSIEQEKKKVKEYVVEYMIIHLYFISNKSMKEIAKTYSLKIKEVSKIIEDYKKKYYKK
jgi:hypothetical protein